MTKREGESKKQASSLISDQDLDDSNEATTPSGSWKLDMLFWTLPTLQVPNFIWESDRHIASTNVIKLFILETVISLPHTMTDLLFHTAMNMKIVAQRDRFSVALYATEERSPELWSNGTLWEAD